MTRTQKLGLRAVAVLLAAGGAVIVADSLEIAESPSAQVAAGRAQGPEPDSTNNDESTEASGTPSPSTTEPAPEQSKPNPTPEAGHLAPGPQQNPGNPSPVPPSPPPEANDLLDGAEREELLLAFPHQFGGLYANTDGTYTLLHVGDSAPLAGWLQERGFASGINFRETSVSLHDLRRRKVALEQNPELAPGTFVEAVGIRDSDGSLTVSVVGDLTIAEDKLLERLGRDQVFRVSGPIVEQ